MLSSVLSSDRAVMVNIAIMRAFVKIRELLASHTNLGRKLEQLEATQKKHGGMLQQHGSLLLSVVQDIQKLKNPPPTRAIGFLVPYKPKSPTKKREQQSVCKAEVSSCSVSHGEGPSKTFSH